MPRTEEPLIYSPRAHAVPDESRVRELVERIGSAQLITAGTDGYPEATLLPIVWRGPTVRAHLARANPHWQRIGPGQPVLLVVAGPDAYISPSWYPSKAEHGRVVPTWNSTTVHLTGRATIRQDEPFLRAAVEELVDRHEQGRERPWSTSDAPERFVAGQLRAIVGIEITIERFAAKAKQSQNRPPGDRRGVVAGLRREGTPNAAAVAEEVEHELDR